MSVLRQRVDYVQVQGAAVQSIWGNVVEEMRHHMLHNRREFIAVVGTTIAAFLGFVIWRMSQQSSRPVYLMDYSVLKPDDSLKMTNAHFVEKSIKFAVGHKRNSVL